MEDETKLYPDIQPTAPPLEPTSFRLQRICDLQKMPESEQQARAALYKKYKRALNAVEVIDATLVASSIAVGAIGAMGVLSNIITIPLATVLGVLGVSGKLVGRRLQVKAKKHDEIRLLAESKLNTIADHVSKALRDGVISDEEFCLVLNEIEKYGAMKARTSSL